MPLHANILPSVTATDSSYYEKTRVQQNCLEVYFATQLYLLKERFIAPSDIPNKQYAQGLHNHTGQALKLDTKNQCKAKLNTLHNKKGYNTHK